RTHHGYFHGCRGGEVHDAADDVAGLERELCIREPLMELIAQCLLKDREARRLRSERHLQHPFMRAACPQKDRVDRVGRGLDSYVAERDGHIVGASSLSNDVQYLMPELFGCLELRTRRCAE